MLNRFRAAVFCLRPGVLIVFIQLFCFIPSQSQITSFNFRHLTSNEGLSDGVIHAFVQDKYGFVWIGTTYGLNRYDGINIKSWFFKPGDQKTLADNYVQSLYSDSKGNLWIGTRSGLCRYDYAANQFIRYSSGQMIISNILEDKKGRVWLGTNYGLWIVNDTEKKIQQFAAADAVLQKNLYCSIQQIISSPEGEWYLATDKGIKIFDPLTNAYSEIRHVLNNKFSLSYDNVSSLALDHNDYLWAICTDYNSVGNSTLNKIDLKGHTVKYYDRFVKAEKKWSSNTLNKCLVDRKGRVWITASASGLSVYDPVRDDFIDHKIRQAETKDKGT